MPDLKTNLDSLLTEIDAEHARCLASLDQCASRLKEDVKMVAAVLVDLTKINIADADAAQVMDLNVGGDMPAGTNIGLQVGYAQQHARLSSTLPAGRYRAVILLNRLED